MRRGLGRRSRQPGGPARRGEAVQGAGADRRENHPRPRRHHARRRHARCRRPKDVLTFDADAAGSSGAHAWSLTADPPVPGLGYTLQLVAFTPWKSPEAGGLALTVTPAATMTAGVATALQLQAAFPAGTEHDAGGTAPCGCQHDTPSLNALAASGGISRDETKTGRSRSTCRPSARAQPGARRSRSCPRSRAACKQGHPHWPPKPNLGAEGLRPRNVGGERLPAPLASVRFDTSLGVICALQGSLIHTIALRNVRSIRCLPRPSPAKAS